MSTVEPARANNPEGDDYWGPRTDFWQKYKDLIKFTMHPDKVGDQDHIQYGLIEEVLEFLMELPRFGHDPNRIEEEAGDVLWYVIAFYELMRWNVTPLLTVITWKHEPREIMLALQKFIKNVRKLDINNASNDNRQEKIFESVRVIMEALKAYTELPLHAIARGNMSKLYKKWDERHSESSD